MYKKLILRLAILVVLMAWPISLVRSHPIINMRLELTGYTKNVLVMTSLNNYFFGNNPQVDVNEQNHRAKFPYVAILPFLIGIYMSIKNKRHLKLWLMGLIIVLFASFLKNMDGWDFLMYPIVGVIIVDGLKDIGKHKFGLWMLFFIIVIGLTEIARIFV